MAHSPFSSILASFLLIQLASTVATAKTIYVDDDATAGGSGASWIEAKRSIGAALAGAGFGDAIWVAEGTYAEAIVTTSGVALYGGFNKSEHSPDDRDLSRHVSMIDAGTAAGGSPAEHVVIMDGVTSVSIDGFVITGGDASGFSVREGGGLFCRNLDATNAVANCAISGNIADYGGGVFCDNSTLRLIDCAISSNTADYGGGVYCDNSTLRSIDCAISTNTASRLGGGILCEGSTLSIVGGSIAGNLAGFGGGNIVANAGGGIAARSFRASSHLTVVDCSIVDNGGGGILVERSLLEATNCSISRNDTGSGEGGAIRFSSLRDASNSITLTSCSLVGNTALHGGAIHYSTVSTTQPLVLTGCQILGNVSGRGGGLFLEGGQATIEGGAICGNSVGSDGGGVLVGGDLSTKTDLSIGNCLFSGNTAGSAGAIFIGGGRTSLDNCRFAVNRASSYKGGAISAEDGVGTVTISSCRFAANSADYTGGAIDFHSPISPEGPLVIADSVFVGNRAFSGEPAVGGGAINQYGGALRLTNTIVGGNHAISGGGIGSLVGTLSVLHSAFVGNGAYGSGGSAISPLSSYPSPVIIANSIFYQNGSIAIANRSSLNYRDVSLLSNCLFRDNVGGDVRFKSRTFTGAAAINQSYEDASGNVDGLPRFVMGPAGQWTAPPVVFVDGDSLTTKTLLTDASASFAPGALVDELIALGDGLTTQAMVAGNTATTLEVWGDQSLDAAAGTSYRILDYHLGPGSAAIDTGTSVGVFVDIDGAARPLDIPGHGAEGSGTEFDIGPYEAQPVVPPSVRSAHWLFY